MSIRAFKRPQPPRFGVLLLNLGGPEKLADVEPFLRNLFSDPSIIRLPIRALQRPVGWLIARLRRRKSMRLYEKIGGGSPQRRITTEQAAALQSELARQGIAARVYVGMVCWHPLIESTFQQILQDHITHLVVLPLFPHFSVTTTGAAAKKLIHCFDQHGGVREMRRSYVTHYETEPGYIAALTDLIVDEMRQFPDPRPAAIQLLFSAHSIPTKYVERGDPYLRHHERTIAAVMTALERRLGTRPPHTLSFQSKVGPVRWLEPSTEATIQRLAREGKTQVLTIPISFVSEHIETLYELDIQYQALAREVGIPYFRRVPALNCHRAFIRGLAALARARLTAGYQAQPAEQAVGG
ncbi:MAG: ferrochelatase [Chloracidobacterium sp.]|uniref:Ferrochelatase n=1 Tax=Chloracidobacterium validum TaxID=2821543 RepID=A0ABX8BCN7_9BACT|nr:ferrochelatase [Chloracidobacterium validum]QUW04677.1 ferrochelatase [Chloracidobacterium validum]